jgi:hypothetical protein
MSYARASVANAKPPATTRRNANAHGVGVRRLRVLRMSVVLLMYPRPPSPIGVSDRRQAAPRALPLPRPLGMTFETWPDQSDM